MLASIIILRRMLIHSRVRHSSKKQGSSLGVAASPLLANNPEIQLLVDRLLVISESLPEQRPRTLNLVQWQREKYRPNENENRIRIENQASLVRVSNERVRSRAKPIRRALSIDLAPHDLPKPYKQHYEEIRRSIDRKLSASEAADSEEEPESPQPASPEQGSIKYLHNLRKYNRLVQFISERVGSREQQGQQLRSFYSQSLPTSPSACRPLAKQSSACEKERVVRLPDSAANGRVSSIVKKWKPASKIDRIFSKTAEIKLASRKRLSWTAAAKERPAEPSLNA